MNMWGPWHTAENKNEGSLAEVQISMADMIQPYRVMDIFEFFTLFATDKKHRKYKIICRYQQYEGANLIVERVKMVIQRRDLYGIFRVPVNRF